MSATELPTPIPLGSPELVNPPMFDRWGLETRRTARVDRRDYGRRRIECPVWLLDLGGHSVVRCRTIDVSDAGLYAVAPIGYGLAVGQRYEVRIAGPDDRHASIPQLGTALGYATVVRTNVRVLDDSPGQVAVALRFDIPQLLPL